MSSILRKFKKRKMKKAEKLIVCCLCNKDIQPNELSGWKYGHNPDPLGKTENDRCCDICNATKVIPERLKRVMQNR